MGFDEQSLRSLNSNVCQNGTCQIPLSLDGIWGYGCWCNFGYDLMQGKGKPVNEFDAVCKSLQLCLRCARMDGDTDGYTCDPSTQGYNAYFSWMPQTNGILADCTEKNPGDFCAQHSCSCE